MVFIPLTPEVADGCREFLVKLLGPTAEEIGLIIGDVVKTVRVKRQAEMLIETQAMIRKAGLVPKKVASKLLFPLLESCTLEEDNTDLKTKWVGLLATAATTDNFSKYSYPHILKELSPIEVKLLDEIFDRVKNELPRSEWLTSGFRKEQICQMLKINVQDYEIMVDNLFRLQLLQPTGSTGVTLGRTPFALRSYEIVSLTPMGYDFIKACRGPKYQESEVSKVNLTTIGGPYIEVPPARFG